VALAVVLGKRDDLVERQQTPLPGR